MATPNVGILTTAGKALIDKVNSGQAKISFSKIVFSSMDNSQLSDMQVKALTAIAPQEVVVSSPETTLDANSGETRIRATGTNEKLADGVYVKTYGVFAKDDKGSEILYGVTVSPNPNYFPAYDGVTPQAVTYSYKTVIQETSNITMTNSNDVYASQEDLTEAIAAIPKPDLSNYATNRQLATKADDSKVVHSTDMRKPASDVAGIEEVNAKQDKIGYTPADDSKVVHQSDMRVPSNAVVSQSELSAGLSAKADAASTTAGLNSKVTDNKNGTITANNLTYDLSKTGITPLSVYKSGSFNDLPLGTVFTDPPMTDGPDTVHSFNTTTFFSSEWSGRKAQIAITDNENLMYFRVQAGSSWNSWTLLSDDSKVVHSTDMRKPASDVAGIEEVNAKQDKIGYTPADDSKVAHLSGANNFDTVPTVNNNPLLLASSLPSDLARTGSNQEFTGKNTFDTAPIDKTTGNPYITKDGVPSDVARTSQQTNFTAGLQSGGVDVATAADLKSIEASAWRQLDNKYISVYSGTLSSNTKILYKIDQITKRIYLSGAVFASDSVAVTVNLSHIIKVSTSTGSNAITFYRDGYFYTSNIRADSTFVISTGDNNSSLIGLRTGNLESAYFNYDELV
ncbi:hypothetical protein [Levilactobacillus brevis]|uniref:hypothetical protein n=1 Tax=Levilactobacillus brevis TaxID=1580 RepID=UPI00207A5E47|nr:hypothetical protein [Levilactobacillus brevis]